MGVGVKRKFMCEKCGRKTTFVLEDEWLVRNGMKYCRRTKWKCLECGNIKEFQSRFSKNFIRVTLTIYTYEFEMLQQLVKRGIYRGMSEAVRTLLRDALIEECARWGIVSGTV